MCLPTHTACEIHFVKSICHSHCNDAVQRVTLLDFCELIYKNIKQKAFNNIKCQTSVHSEDLMSDRAQNIEQADGLNSSLTQENTGDARSIPHI